MNNLTKSGTKVKVQGQAKPPESGVRFVQLDHSAIRDARLKDAGLRVLSVLLTHANSEWICWPSVELIGKECGKKPRAVQNALEQLRRLGYIAFEPDRNRKNGTHRLIRLTPRGARPVEPQTDKNIPRQLSDNPAESCVSGVQNIAGKGVQNIAPKLDSRELYPGTSPASAKHSGRTHMDSHCVPTGREDNSDPFADFTSEELLAGLADADPIPGRMRLHFAKARQIPDATPDDEIEWPYE